jgi:hypothetical protein
VRTTSKKRARLYRGARGELNRELTRIPRRCELGLRFWAADIDSTCSGRATCWHERRKRSAGGSIVNPANILAACAICNSFVEDHPGAARDLGLVLREGDDDWEAMSARHD